MRTAPAPILASALALLAQLGCSALSGPIEPAGRVERPSRAEQEVLAEAGLAPERDGAAGGTASADAGSPAAPGAECRDPSDCTLCWLPAPVRAESECRCPGCPAHPSPAALCEERAASYRTLCGEWERSHACRPPGRETCAHDAIPACVEGRCGVTHVHGVESGPP